MQVKLLGTVTETEERRLKGKIAAAGETPSHPVQAERRLLAAANKNPYLRALMYIQMAPLHQDQQAQVRAHCPCSRVYDHS